MIEPLTLTTDDGVHLEAELFSATSGPDTAPARAAMAICHPHPQYGGSMRSIVVSALADALPSGGVACLRFNFRGVERSTGTWDEGRGERLDVLAAIDRIAELVPGVPLVLAGWSFGADLALATDDDRIGAWFAVAPPLRYADAAAVSVDPRPKLVALGEHDEVRRAPELAALTKAWTNTETVVVPGASHFFVGRTDRLVELARSLVDRLAGTPGSSSR